MIDWLVSRLFWWTPLRNAIFAEVHMYDYLEEIINDPEAMETGSVFYPDFDGWRSWSHNKDNGRYYFNDIPEQDMMEAFKQLEIMESKGIQLEFDMDEVW